MIFPLAYDFSATTAWTGQVTHFGQSDCSISKTRNPSDNNFKILAFFRFFIKFSSKYWLNKRNYLHNIITTRDFFSCYSTANFSLDNFSTDSRHKGFGRRSTIERKATVIAEISGGYLPGNYLSVRLIFDEGYPLYLASLLKIVICSVAKKVCLENQ